MFGLLYFWGIIFEKLPLVNIEWTFSSFFFFLDDLFKLHFLTRCLHFQQKKERKNQFFKYFCRTLLKFEEKIAQIHKHSWLDNLNTQKSELHTNLCWRHSRSQTLSPVPSEQNLWKFIFSNLSSHYLEQFLCFIQITALSLSRFWVIESQL